MSDSAVVAERTGGQQGAAGTVRLAAVFLPAPLPREGRIAFWDPEGVPLPAGSPEADAASLEHTELTVVRPHGAGVRRHTAPALSLPVGAALPLLVRARRDPAAHPATACWGAAALHALRLTARGRLLPGLTATGHDAWRAGPLDPDDIAHLRAVAAALPHEGHAVPLPGPGPLRLPEPEALMRSFLDAVADTLPRTPAAPYASGKPFAARAPQRLPHAHDWAAEVAAGMDAGVRISLRLDLSAYNLFNADADGARSAGAAIVQVHSLADPTLVADAAALWAGDADAVFGPRARVDAALAVRAGRPGVAAPGPALGAGRTRCTGPVRRGVG
ncbi:UNVERIFIED_CONTAM: hypothetical protein RKD50_007350 [Streptomyces canus]